MTAAQLLPGEAYRLTTVEIIYRLPDNLEKLQTFIWQTMDVAPEFPRMNRFIQFWREHIEGELYSVRVGQAVNLRRSSSLILPGTQTRH